MNIKECYDKAGANYEDALNRLGSDMLVECFALKFLQDDSFKQLTDGLAEKDGEKAFRGARTLKGVCVNLGFDNLYEVRTDRTALWQRDRRMPGNVPQSRRVLQ